jgi:hypothetical protein
MYNFVEFFFFFFFDTENIIQLPSGQNTALADH